MPIPVVDLLDHRELQAGLLAGGIATGCTAVLLVASRRREPAPIAGLIAAGVGAYVLSAELDLPGEIWNALALLALAGWLGGGGGLRRLLMPVLAVPGAVLLSSHAALPDDGWVRPLVALSTIAGGCLAADFDRRWRHRGLGPPFLALAAVGVLYTVPENAEAMVVTGAVLPVMFLAWPRPLASLGSSGSMAAVGLLMWTVGVNGQYREGALVGGVASLALLGLEPIGRGLRRRGRGAFSRLPARWWSPVLLGLLQLALVFVASRVAGTKKSADDALRLLVPVAGVTLVLLALATRDARAFFREG